MIFIGVVAASIGRLEGTVSRIVDRHATDTSVDALTLARQSASGPRNHAGLVRMPIADGCKDLPPEALAVLAEDEKRET
jgi:hypothetical protein